MDNIFLFVAAFLTSSISAILGMGGGIILLGIMALIIPDGYIVVALHGIIQLVSNVTRSYVYRRHIKKNIIKQYLPGAVCGLLISAIIIVFLINIFNVSSAKEIKVDILKPIIGIFIIWFLYGKKIQVKQNKPHFFPVGLLSGVCTVFIGATGPLIAPFFLVGKLTKENIISNKAVCQAISHVGKIPLFMIFFDFKYFTEIHVLFPLIIAVFIGTNFGKYIINFIPENIFRYLFKISLTIISVKLIITNFI